ncbi:hypothetical protein FTX61_04755 [Nitriliruptoraceae bacterium ZYF776]|nr:hypothetical protein [Profundirhabdus halotolerans]
MRSGRQRAQGLRQSSRRPSEAGSQRAGGTGRDDADRSTGGGRRGYRRRRGWPGPRARPPSRGAAPRARRDDRPRATSGPGGPRGATPRTSPRPTPTPSWRAMEPGPARP